ncbi:MAG: YfaP family protein [Polyangiaceae bacterium]
MRWSSGVDVDLHVVDPTGAEIYFSNPSVPSGGFLDADNTVGGPGSIENVTWATRVPGTYQYFAVNYGGGDAGGITLEVHEDGSLVASQTASVGSAAGAESQRFTFNLQ